MKRFTDIKISIVKPLHYSLLFFTMLALLSCDPPYAVQWNITNHSITEIEVVSNDIFSFDTVLVKVDPEETLVLFDIFDVGASASCEGFGTSNTTHFKFLQITNENGDTIRKDVLAISHWNCQDLEGDFVQFNLMIFDEDF